MALAPNIPKGCRFSRQFEKKCKGLQLFFVIRTKKWYKFLLIKPRSFYEF